jgi:hypothetical protein
LKGGHQFDVMAVSPANFDMVRAGFYLSQSHAELGCKHTWVGVGVGSLTLNFDSKIILFTT